MAITDRQLTINTTEQVSLNFEIAGIGSRFMAFLVDSLIQVLCYVGIGLVAALVWSALPAGKNSANIGPKWMLALAILSGYLVYSGYFALFETWWSGQTPGKRYVGIRVVKDNGRGITAGEAVSRNFMRVVDSLPAGYIFGLITMLIGQEKKRIGDYVAGTIVVHEKTADEKDVNFDPLQDRTVAQEWTTRLTEKDLELIESFLHRRYTLEQSVRYGTGARIAEHIKNKSGALAEAGEGTDEFLERVAASIRNSRRV